MQARLIGVAAAALLTAAPIAATAAEYKVDKAHTGVTFKIRHLFTNVSGRFDDFEGKVTFDPENFADASAEGTIQTASINTNNEKRDTHLKSPDFFDVEKYPTITFKSTKVTDVDKEKMTGKLHGNLTMHGVEKPIVLDVAYLGTAKDPWGNTRGGFVATTTINRKDFGINWNQTLDSGGLFVGEEVDIEINVEGVVE
jgi:polyisoprenoid-binding protein YceI